MYHKIGPCPQGALVPHHYVSTRRFSNHVLALVKFGFTSKQLCDLVFDQDQSQKLTALTFDDGYSNFADLAVPILQKHGQKATVFVVAGLLGATNEWDVKIGDKPEPLMSLEQLVEIQRMGFEVGSHSMTHARLTELNQNDANLEIQDSKRALSEQLGQTIETFCYPYGSQNESLRAMVRDAGYKYACSVEKGWNHSTTDPYCLKRINVRSDTSTPILFWKLWRQNRRVQ